MGGEGSGRKPDPIKALLRKESKEPSGAVQIQQPIIKEMFLPNHSGIPFNNTDSVIGENTYDLNQVYQNNSGNTIIITYNILTSVSFLGDAAYTLIKVGTTNPPTSERYGSGVYYWGTSGDMEELTQLHSSSFTVKRGDYWKIESVRTGAGIVTLININHLKLGI